MAGEEVQDLLAAGTRFLRQRKPAQALSPLLKAYRLAPENVAVKINLGSAYILAGKHALAVPVLEEAIALEPENENIWINLAAAYLGKLPFATKEKREKALAAFREALAINPRAYSVHYNMALIFHEQGDIEEAKFYFQEALRVNPDDDDARRWLQRLGGEFRAEQGQDDANSKRA